MSQLEVSVIIVNYQSLSQIHQCLNSIANHTQGIEHEIIVVDNEANQMLAEQLKGKNHVKYIAASTNLGYGGGNNLGADHAGGKYLLFLNPDILLRDNLLKILSDFLQRHDQVGVVAPRQVHQDGSQYHLQGSGKLTPFRYIMSHTIIHRLWPTNPVARKYYLHDQAPTNIVYAAAVPGSAFMISKQLFDQVGRFDESIFMYFEEHDLGMRVCQHSYKLALTPDTTVIHNQHNTDSPHLAKIYNQSRKRYFSKHFGKIQGMMLEFSLFLLNWKVFIIFGFAVLLLLVMN